MDHCGNQAFNAAELKYTVAKRSNRCIPPKPSKGNEAYTGGGSVCSGKKRKQKIQEVLQNPPPTRRPKIKGILISALVESVRGRKREEKQLVEEKDMREGNKRGMLNKEVKVYFRWMRKIWLSRKLKQPAKLPELGMDPENEGIISDILRFVRKKAIYRKEGKPWKRGYLLFDSPGTADRSSLIAAMANRLEFDIFDLNLTGLTSISELTNVLVSIRKRSIIFIKDFDHWAPYLNNELTLSGLSKIIHGLLSSCGDEQIIVLTTNHNHIDGVDAALLRSLNNDLYIHTPSPRPKALSNGGEIVPLDSSEQKPMVDFDATNNRANQSDVLVSNSEEKNAREALRSLSEAEPCLVSLGDLMTGFSLTDFDDLDSNAHQHHVFSQGSPIATSSQGPPIATSAIITKDDLQRPHGSVTRKDAAAILRVSESTVKRIWKECKMGPWKNGGKRRVLRPPDPHGKRNTSIACETPHNVQPGMEGEPVGQNQEANVFRRDFMRGPIAWNTESGSIMVSRPPDQLGERNTSTACETPSHNVHTGMEGEPLGQNQDANEFRRDFMEHSIALNTENDSIIAVYSETEAAWGSSKWAFQLEGQTMQSTTYPYHDDLVFFQSQIASTEVVNENMGSSQDRRDLLASQVVAPQKEPLLEGHVFGFGNWTVDSCSDLASSQTMCNFSQATGSSENLENWLAFMEEHLKEENIYGPSRSDPAPSQPKRTIHHTMATIPHMMPLPTERQDMRSVKLKATYGDTKIKFQFPLTSGINELMEVMSKIMERELGSFKVEYKDEDGEWILITLDEHVREHLQLLTSLGNKVTELKVQDKVPNTTDIDAPESGACLVRANQSGPIMLNSEKKHTSEGLIGECLTESVLSLNDSTKRKSFSNFDATELKAHLVRAYQSGPVVSLPENQNRGEASKRECITKSIFGLEDLQQHCGGRPDAAAKSFRTIYDPGFHTPDSVAGKSFEVLETLPARKQPNDGVPLLLPGRLTQEKSPNLPRVMQFNGVEQRVTKMPRYLGGLTAQSASSSCGPIGLPDGGHIVLLDALDQSTKNIEHVATADQCSPTLSLPEKKMVRKTLNRNCRTMSVIFEEKHQRYVRRCEGATKSLGAMCISRKHGINQVSMVEPIHKQRGIHQWPFLQSAVGLPDGGHILSLLEKKIVRKTLKRKCRSMSVLSLEDHKQHVDRRWEDAAKSHGAKRICRQLVIHRLSTAKCIRKQIGIHQWPFQRSTIGLPDGGRILPLSEKKIVRKTLKRKCRSMSVLSLVDRQQHVDRRWEDAAKNIGAKRICRQLVIHRVFIAKRICRQHGIHHRWPFERDWATKKGYSLGDERPVEVICISTHAELVSRLQLIYLSWLGRFSPRPSALPRGGLIVGPIALSSSEFAATNYLAQRVGQHQSRVGLVVGPIALSSSEFAATNNLAQRVGQDQRGSGASGSENERTREQEDPRQDQRGSGASGSENERTRKQKDPKEKRTSITKDDLLQLPYRMTVEDAAAYLKVSKSTVKRKWGECNMGPWNKRVWRPPDQHGEGNTSTARETPSHNVQTGMEGEPVGQNQEANECQRDFRERQIALSTESGLIMVLRPPDQHGERNTSTAHETPSHNVQTGIEGVPVGQNQEANEFQPDFTGGSIPLNTENCLIIGSSFGWASQVNDQTLSAPDPNHDALVFSPPQITLLPSENRGVSIDLRNSVASQAEPFSDRHISGSRNLAFRTCSYQAAPSQHVEGQAMQSTDHNAFMFPQTQMVSPQEPFSDRHISRFSNFATCSDQAAPSQHVGGQSMPTVYPDPNAFEVSNWNKDTNSVEEIIIKAFCGERTKRTIYRFRFPLTSGIDDLKKEVSKRLNVEVDRFEVKYKDKKKQLISIPCDEDLMLYLSSSLENDDIEVFVLDKGRTPNFCERCRSSMQTRA